MVLRTLWIELEGRYWYPPGGGVLPDHTDNQKGWHDQRWRLWWRLGWRLLKPSVTGLRNGLGRWDWYPRRGGDLTWQVTYPKWPSYHFLALQVIEMTFWGNGHRNTRNWARGTILVSSWSRCVTRSCRSPKLMTWSRMTLLMTFRMTFT